MKKIAYCIILCCSLLFPFVGSVGQTAKNVIDEVVWVVGDEAIFKSEIEDYIRTERLQGNAISANDYCKYAEDLAVQKLFLHQAELDSVEANEEWIAIQVNYRYEDMLNYFGTEEKLSEYMGKTPTQIKEKLREVERMRSRILSVRSTIEDKVHVTPAEVRNFMDQLPEDSIPMVPMRVEVQLLMKEPEVPLEEIERVKGELRDYTERINNGMSFSSLAILYSEDPESARRGGETGLIPRAALDPAFASVAFALQDTKKVSQIVQSEFGYHIIQLIEKRGDRINCRHILRIPKVSDEELQSNLFRLDTLANDIRRGKISFEQAVALLSDDKDTHMNNGLMQNAQTQTSRFEMDELPVEVARAIENMNVNEVSAPFLMKNSKGRDVCAIVKLRNRIPTHRASMSEDFQLLQNIVLNRRKAEAVKKWIAEKQKTTFVHISDNWKQCDFQYEGWQIR
ncbi:MAG: peptidylprolyl isomerase [Bacteroidaceae bacterium]